MENYVQVRPEHLNHYGYLFGGIMLKWVDEFAWLAAAMDFPGYTFVTVTMDKSLFKHRVENGSILKFSITPVKIGNTSVSYNVVVNAVATKAENVSGNIEVFSTTVKFVAIDNSGKSIPLPKKMELKSGKFCDN